MITWLVEFCDLHNDGGDKIVEITADEKREIEAAMVREGEFSPGEEIEDKTEGDLFAYAPNLATRLYEKQEYAGVLRGTKRIKVPVY